MATWPGGEVDGAAHGVVDAAHVQHQNPVDVDPDVVVAGELKDHVPAADLAVFRCMKLKSMERPKW